MATWSTFRLGYDDDHCFHKFQVSVIPKERLLNLRNEYLTYGGPGHQVEHCYQGLKLETGNVLQTRHLEA